MATWAVLGLSTLAVFAIAYYAPNTPLWNAVNNLLLSVVASGIFAIVSVLYVSYFFIDAEEEASKSLLLPQDIAQALRSVAAGAADYKIYVRTGRHFRAEILPLLVARARETRLPIRVEAVLLDFRNMEACERYANYRSTASFDRQLWDLRYVQSEVLATVLALVRSAQENRGLIDVELYLSSRLSTFRIEGSSDEIIVTREDPKDTASRYKRSHRDFSAFAMEFGWIRDDAFHVAKNAAGAFPTTVEGLFGPGTDLSALAVSAERATSSRSPYVR